MGAPTLTEFLLSSPEARWPRAHHPCEWPDGSRASAEHEDTEGLASLVDFARQDYYGAVRQSPVSEILVEAIDEQ
jgi:hypothetical protein